MAAEKKGKTAIRKIIDFAGLELKLEGYEHQQIIDKAIGLLGYEKEQFCIFFKWFRDNGDSHIGKSIEQLVDIFYLETYHVREYLQKHVADEEDEIYSIEDWNETKWMMYDQGKGYWMKDGFVSSDDVDITPQEDATHVLWFPK